MNHKQRISAQRRRMLDTARFYAVLALRLDITEESESKCPTMATDGMAIFYSQPFVDKQNDAKLRGVIAHEVLHCALGHFARIGNRKPKIWNVACDYAINPILKKDGFTLPDGGLDERRFHGMSAETIYPIIFRESEERKSKGERDPDSWDCVGELRKPTPHGDNGGREGDKPGGAPSTPADAESLADDWRIAAVTAANAERKAGRQSAGAARVLGDAKAPARIDWRETLRQFVASSSETQSTWSRPNRRHVHAGLYLPGRTADAVPKGAVAVDTSGSVGNRELKAGESEIDAALNEGMVDSLVAVFCDAAVTGSQLFERGDTVKLDAKGGGGTAFAPAIAWIVANHPDAAFIVYITDLCGYDFGPEPPMPVLWVCTCDYGTRPPPFGEVVRLHVD